MSETGSEVVYNDGYTNIYVKEDNYTGAPENGQHSTTSPDVRRTALPRTNEVEEPDGGEGYDRGTPTRKLPSQRSPGTTHIRNLSSDSQGASPYHYADSRERSWYRTKSGLAVYVPEVNSKQEAEENDQLSKRRLVTPSKHLIDYNIEWLDLSKRGIEEKHTKCLARALETGKLQNVKTLFLEDNAGDFGMRALLNGLQGNHLNHLVNLILWNVSSYDQITAFEKGTESIASAISMGKLAKLERLDMNSTLYKLIPPRPWATVFQDLATGSLGQGRLRKYKHMFLDCFSIDNSYSSLTLECLNCHVWKMNIYNGDDGLKKIIQALSKSRPPLKFLHLRENYIGVNGVKYLAQMLRRGVLPDLEEVDIQNNHVGVDGARQIVRAYLANPLLTTKVMLDWVDPILKLRASAFRERNIILEQRLEELKHEGVKMEHGKISKAYKWRPKLSLVRAPTARSYKCYLQCQHPDHQHSATEALQESHSGIQIRVKSLFGSSPTKLVETEYNWKSTHETEIGRSGEMTDAEPEQTVAAFSCCSPSRKPRSLTHEQKARTAPTEGKKPDSLANTQAHTSALQSDPTPAQDPMIPVNMVRTVEEGGMYITAPSSLFIQMVKSLSQNRQDQELMTLVDKVKSRALSPFQSRRKNRKQVDAMILELLMVADRKPSEFHQMFGLSRMLLRAADFDGHHYPAYVCDHCKADAVAPVHELVPTMSLQDSLSRQLSESDSESTEGSHSVGIYIIK
ncbi:hypothetical protein R1sor_014031 [Riccia sorocarpa]|uniref:Uncharacterized protein n=1 Tax=Riccia sorocarpa TaxID=122646 RepID=A0ABD3H887_9MARC